jgi:serine/threonine-protein kinase
VVKLIRRHLSENAAAVARFATEARAAASLRHTNIVEVYEAGESDAGMFIAMEWVDGPTLRKLMEPGPVAMANAVEWSRQAARGLAAAHEAGIVHRDIKPENIMLNGAGEVKLLDFGLARLSGAAAVDAPASGGSGTISGTLSGTFSYLAPELLMGETASAATDIFAMGSVLYELFTGRHPFAGETPLDVYEAIECRTPDAPSAVRAGVPAVVDRMVLRMLDRDADGRPGAAEIAATLEALVS